MTKSDFLIILRKKLISIPEQDRRKTIQYYSEMIDDRIEEGFSEEDAVEQIGSVYELASQIMSDYKEQSSDGRSDPNSTQQKKSVNLVVVILLILGFPLWFSLLLTAFAVLVSLFITLWSVIIAFWSVFVSFIACAFSGFIVGIVFNILGNVFPGTAMIGAALILAGLSVFSFYGCKALTKGAAFLTKQVAVLIKNVFIKRRLSDA